MRTRFAAFLVVAFCSNCLLGQTAARSNGMGGTGFIGSAEFQAPSPYALFGVVTGAPYSGEEVTEQVQTLADGTHITQKQSPSRKFRDSSGRTRTERPIFRAVAIPGHSTDTPLVVEIVDPVAQVKYTLDTINQVAHRQKLAALPAAGANPVIFNTRGVAVAGSPVPGNALLQPLGVSGVNRRDTSLPVQDKTQTQPQTSFEKLGTQTVEGVIADGTRSTTTFPAGSQGNDRPISVIHETWISRDLKITILSKSSDPRSGEHTQKLINISLSEPSASLFLPPPDYTVVDEEGSFSMKWGSR